MPTVDRVAFTIFGLDVYWYAVIIVTGMILGITMAIILAKRRGVSSDDFLDLILWVIPIAIIGARLFYVVFDWDASWTFARIFKVRDGGLAIYGGVIFGAITAILVCRHKKYNFRKTLMLLDCIVVGVILGQCIGRWGNFVNQEAFGNLITDAAWQWFPAAVFVRGNWYQATFFYESLWNFIGFIILFTFSYKRPKLAGITSCGYFIYYGIGRLFIEGLRSDSLYFMKNVLGEVIRISQVLSLVFIIVACVALYYIIKYNKKYAEKLIAKGEAVVTDFASEKTIEKVEKMEEHHNEVKSDIEKEINNSNASARRVIFEEDKDFDDYDLEITEVNGVLEDLDDFPDDETKEK